MDNLTIELWTFLIVTAALSIYLEQKYRWAAHVSGVMVALVITMLTANLGLIPTESSVYDNVWKYIVPLSIPLLLFSVDIKSIFLSSRRLLVLFLIASLGTFVGTLIAYYLLADLQLGLAKMAAALSASYTGGTVNFIAIADKVNLPKKDLAAALVADNFMTACLFIILIGLVTSKHVLSFWGSIQKEEHYTKPNQFQNKKAISLLDITFSLSSTFLIVTVSFISSAFLKEEVIPLIEQSHLQLFMNFVSDKYLILTTLTLLLVSFFPRFFQQLHSSSYLGTLGIFIFFATIGAPTSIQETITEMPVLFLFVLIIVACNLIFTLFWGKIFRYPIEEIVLACNATIGGPSTAVALATSQKWHQLIGPILIIGSFGYALGNYVGSIVYLILSHYP